MKIDTIIASADSENSDRPRLTVTPFSQASGIKIQQPFPDKEVKALAHWLAAGTPNRTILIAWHHGKLPKLLRELGADSEELVPGGVWPEDTYDWLIVLKYDSNGNLSEAKKIVEPAFAKLSANAGLESIIGPGVTIFVVRMAIACNATSAPALRACIPRHRECPRYRGSDRTRKS